MNIKYKAMTLNEYIEVLTSLRDRHSAGDFVCKIEGIETDGWEMVGSSMVDMDGDDFRLNLDEHTVEITPKYI